MSRQKPEMTVVLPQITDSAISSNLGLKIERAFAAVIEALHGDRCIQATREIKRYRHLLAKDARHVS